MEGDLGLGYAGGVADGSGEVMGGRMTGGRGGGDQNMFFGESWESSFPSHLHLDVKSSIFDSQYVAHYNADIMNSPGIISFIYHFYTYIIFFILFLIVSFIISFLSQGCYCRWTKEGPVLWNTRTSIPTIVTPRLR